MSKHLLRLVALTGLPLVVSGQQPVAQAPEAKGVQRSPARPPAPAPKPPPGPPNQVVVTQVRVQAVTKTGIKSKVVVKGADKSIDLGDTDDSGVYAPNYQCALGERLRAEPYDKSYWPKTEVCAPSVTFTLTSKNYAALLIKMAKASADGGDFGTAAVMYGNLAEVGRQNDLPETTAWTVDTIRYAGQAAAVKLGQPTSGLNAANPCRIIHEGNCELSAEYRDVFMKYRIANSMDVSGGTLLDYEALSSLGGTTGSTKTPLWTFGVTNAMVQDKPN